MVVIRLSRGGVKKRPFYYIVASDKRRSRDGRYIEQLGYYNPNAKGKEEGLHLLRERVAYWISKGAQPSERVQKLVKTYDKQATHTEATTAA